MESQSSSGDEESGSSESSSENAKEDESSDEEMKDESSESIEKKNVLYSRILKSDEMEKRFSIKIPRDLDDVSI